MNDRYLRSVVGMAALLQVIMALYYLLRGHNDPGGGFIAGLIGGSAWILLIIADHISLARAWTLFQIFVFLGVFLALGSGGASFFAGLPFLTGLWGPSLHFQPVGKVLASNILTFDTGVFLTVMGFCGLFFLVSQEDKT